MTAIRASVKRAVRAVPLPWLPWLPAAAVLLGTGWGSNQFTPMLLVYRQALGLGTGTLEAMFGFYALGLIPGLLIAGPLSDAHGRRRVAVPAAALSLAASLALVAGAGNVPMLFAGRLLAGVSNGAAFAAGTALALRCTAISCLRAVPEAWGQKACFATSRAAAGLASRRHKVMFIGRVYRPAA